MIRPFTLVAIIGALASDAGVCVAQTRDPYTDVSQYLIAPGGQVVPNDRVVGSTNGSNTSIVNQVGNNNSVSIDIQGAYNLTSQIQSGTGNQSALVILGDQNNLHNTQFGNNNSANISVAGNSNNISNTQIGTNLNYGLTQVGNGRTVSVTQTGVGR
jgi:hypothetical protein